MSAFLKDPNARLDYQIDWSSWLGVDTISVSTWIVEAGITQETVSNTTTTATIWLSGGTVGTTYRVTNRITTAAGRVTDWSLMIVVQEK